jgi:23S rRNA (cytosine1962-C5)-methyltransferase
VDISEEALDVARENARINGFDTVEFRAANCFDLLREQTDAGEQYDLVILDPPAFTKNKAAVQSAIRGYKEINLRGLKLVRPGGFLVTCSCSQHVLTDMFQNMVNEAARDAKKRIRMVEYRTQDKDHPILPQSIETKYLKTMILQVME